MNFSRQALLGIGMIIGGSVMLYAMAQQISDSNKPHLPSALIDQPSSEQESSQPLTTDIETEKRILAQKQKERAARVAEQEMRAQQFLTEQEAAEAEALAKARAESQQYVASNTPKVEESDSSESSESASAQSTDDNSTNTSNETATSASTRDQQQAVQAKQDAQRQAALKEQAAAEKAAREKKDAEAKRQADAKKQADAQALAERKKEAAETAKAEAAKNEPPKSSSDYQVKRGDGLIKLARQYNMPVEVLAQANDLSPSTSLRVGQNITIPSRSQVQRLEREAAAAEKSAEAKRNAQQKLTEARKEVKETDAKGSFGVQVALANNQAKADELAKKLQAAGYQVKTSTTSRGVRVIVGPERGKVAALALKDKINSDPKLNASEAWVLYWR
ncbi:MULTISPECIES: LysM peptidoglycan-binding domain-containing protein [Psychrobacter]|uniref:TolA protein n=1 Tax=Psychrobacter alimentarius TaxID=261164 RepID=A0ABN4MZU0_9GAMM|nr:MULTISPECIES: LysM peptidoglycan-binding domain-containing protein [Psychrobacter]AMT96180.1 TolA protein [Psychrobacter alimentarius]QCB31409.1 LysM peptidoglycan-binding domain-containing protein [Psychrobacter sp. PAMC27889]